MASHCSLRGAVGGILLRFSNGVSSRSILNSRNHRLLPLLTMTNSLSSISSISPHTTTSSHSDERNCSKSQVRKIWISSPLCMGRRSSKIAGRKVRFSLCFSFQSSNFWMLRSNLVVLEEFRVCNCWCLLLVWWNISEEDYNLTNIVLKLVVAFCK